MHDHEVDCACEDCEKMRWFWAGAVVIGVILSQVVVNG